MRSLPFSSPLARLGAAALAAVLMLSSGCRTSGSLDSESLVDAGAPPLPGGSGSALESPAPAVEDASVPTPPPTAAANRFPKVEIAKKTALSATAEVETPTPASTTNFDPSPAGNPPSPINPNATGSTGTGGETATAPGLQNMISDVYRLKPLDQVITTMRFPVQQSTEDVVDEKGSITLPLLGEVKAAGFTTSELETELAKRYVDGGFYKRVIITVLVPTLNYTISGEVYRPGRYEIRGTVTLVQAIAEGGNFTEFANKKKVQIIRGTQFIEKNYFDILSDPRQDIEILPRDSIRVPRGW